MFNFMKIHPMGAEFFHMGIWMDQWEQSSLPHWRMDGQADL